MNRPWFLTLRLAAPRLVLLLLLIALGFTLAVLHWEWAALLVMGGITLVVLLIWPQYTLCLLAFAVPFGSIRTWTLGPVNVGTAELLLVLLLAVWLVRKIAARRIVIPQPPLLLPLLLFLAALFLSTLVTLSLELSAKEIVKWLEVLFIYLFMADMVDERCGRWIVWALLVAGGAEALVGVYQFLYRVGPEGFVLFGRFMRAYGHFAQPNPFAGYLGLTLPLAYALTLDAAGSRKYLAARHFAPYLLLPTCCLLLCMAAMVMSWSRGGWVALMAALVVITVLRSRAALFIAMGVGVLAAYLLLIGGIQYFPPALVQRVADFMPYLGGIDVRTVEVTDANWALVERMAHWLAAVDMFSDHPLLGVGIGNYPVAYPQYAIGRWRDPLGHAHNYYLNVAAEAGIIGLGAYLFLFTACFAHAWHVNQRTQGYWRAVALGALGVLVYLSVHSLFDNLFVHSMNVQLALVFGLLCVAERSVGAQHADRH